MRPSSSQPSLLPWVAATLFLVGLVLTAVSVMAMVRAREIDVPQRQTEPAVFPEQPESKPANPTALPLAVTAPALPAAPVKTPVPPTPTQTPEPVPTFTLPPAETATPTPEEKDATGVVGTYVVKSGDTLSSIANRHEVTVQELKLLNNLANPDSIRAGQELKLPPHAKEPKTEPDTENGGEEEGRKSIPAPSTQMAWPSAELLGKSVNGHPIESYRFGIGYHDIVLVGGIHGGFEWNSILLAWEAITHFTNHPELVPPAVSLFIIPAANPDGLHAVADVTGRFERGQIPEGDVSIGRFNGNNTDLNRNWGCNWSTEARWQHRTISGGEAPFSEPETQALRDFFLRRHQTIRAVVFWHSQANLIAPANCDGLYQPSLALAEQYGKASRYPVREFTAYPVTGDATDWLASQGIAAITVELRTRTSTEWNQNLAGILALLEPYATLPAGCLEDQCQ